MANVSAINVPYDNKTYLLSGTSAVSALYSEKAGLLNGNFTVNINGDALSSQFNLNFKDNVTANFTPKVPSNYSTINLTGAYTTAELTGQNKIGINRTDIRLSNDSPTTGAYNVDSDGHYIFGKYTKIGHLRNLQFNLLTDLTTATYTNNTFVKTVAKPQNFGDIMIRFDLNSTAHFYTNIFVSNKCFDPNPNSTSQAQPSFAEGTISNYTKPDLSFRVPGFISGGYLFYYGASLCCYDSTATTSTVTRNHLLGNITWLE